MSYTSHARDLLWRFKLNVSSLLGPRSSHLRGVGLGLSGGVDSMALAWLWHTAAKTSEGPDDPFAAFRNVPFHAIVVDHKLRAVSGSEAQLTSERFSKITNRKASIIELDWASAQEAARSRGETSARRLRYRALGQTCLEKNINLILTAHHADDNAESVLLRLCRGTTGLGLEGISPYIRIPECEDLEGISEQIDTSRAERQIGYFHRLHHLGIMSNSMFVARPLLPFPKSDLIKLCQEVGIDWAEDKSNADVTLTARNAVRSLLRSDSLPMALQKDSIVAFAGRKLQAQQELLDKVKTLRDNSTRTLALDSGVLSVLLPDAQMFTSCDPASRRAFIRELTSAVCHTREVPLTSCTVMSRDVFAQEEAFQTTVEADLPDELRPRGSMSGEPFYSLLLPAQSVIAASHLTIRKDGNPGLLWHFVRAPIAMSHRNRLYMYLSNKDGCYTNPRSPHMDLWDGRFWMKIHISEHRDAAAGFSQQSQKKYVVRSLTKADRNYLSQMASSKIPAFEADKYAGPAAEAIRQYHGMRRFGQATLTIPVVSEMMLRPDGREEEGPPIAIPSLGYVQTDYSERISISYAFRNPGSTADGLLYETREGLW